MDAALAPSITDNEFNLIINGAESFTQCASAIAAHGRERIKKLLDSKKFQVKLAGAGARSFSERNGKLYIGLDIPIEEFEYRMGMLLQTVAESPRSALSGDSTKVKEIIRWSDIKGWIEYHDVAPRSRPSSRQGSRINLFEK